MPTSWCCLRTGKVMIPSMFHSWLSTIIVVLISRPPQQSHWRVSWNMRLNVLGIIRSYLPALKAGLALSIKYKGVGLAQALTPLGTLRES